MLTNTRANVLLEFIAVFILLAMFFAFNVLNFPAHYFIIFLVGVIFFVLAFVSSNLVLFLVVLATLLSPEFEVGAIRGRAIMIRFEDLFIILIVLGWLARLAMNKELGLLKFTPLNTPILVFLLIEFVSTSLGIIRQEIKFQNSAFYFLKYAEYYLLFFMVVNNIKTMKQARFFVFLTLATCAIVCIYALSHLPSGIRLSAPFEGKGGEPNTFSGYLLLMMSLIIALLLYAQTTAQRVTLLALGGMALVSFVYTLSRGGWLAFFPMLTAFIVLTKRYRHYFILFFIALVIALPHMLPQRVTERLEDVVAAEKEYQIMGKRLTFSASTAARIDAWADGFSKWVKKPILGYGISAGGVMDNQYTRVLVETGALGFLVFIWLLVRIFHAARRSFVGSKDDLFARAVSLGFLVGFLALLIHSLSAATFILIRVMEPFWFLAAIVVALPHLEPLAAKGGEAHAV
ncbi:MAG TPA: O-antigen ligase family protein [Candidatus Omnitrophota bacterium]|nr:O-antigen ligase family protein [Candidatus Omnitrophota bacterium]HRZ14513.1 O-antigen ligase family protein [Candidatus Omnitrophota bacterium]